MRIGDIGRRALVAGPWVATAGLALLYALRVWALGGFYIVTYGLGIYLLNLFIGFITPQVRAARMREARARLARARRAFPQRSPARALSSLCRPRGAQIDPETEGPLLPRSGGK